MHTQDTHQMYALFFFLRTLHAYFNIWQLYLAPFVAGDQTHTLTAQVVDFFTAPTTSKTVFNIGLSAAGFELFAPLGDGVVQNVTWAFVWCFFLKIFLSFRFFSQSFPSLFLPFFFFLLFFFLCWTVCEIMDNEEEGGDGDGDVKKLVWLLCRALYK